MLPKKQEPFGLFEKYEVNRRDGRSDPPGIRYFVLKLSDKASEHDRAALKAYAESCKEELPELSKDLLERLEEITPITAEVAEMAFYDLMDNSHAYNDHAKEKRIKIIKKYFAQLHKK